MEAAQPNGYYMMPKEQKKENGFLIIFMGKLLLCLGQQRRPVIERKINRFIVFTSQKT